jgi:hypothetical protein
MLLNVIGNTISSNRRGGGVVFDADYQAVLNYATSLGYTLPSSGQQVKQNQLMLDLKSGVIWSKLDTFAMFATDGSEAFSRICWKRLITMTAINSPTFTTNVGWNGNGTSSYIDPLFNPSTFGGNYTLNNACFGSGGNITTTSAMIATNQARGNLRSNASNFNGINSTTSVSPLNGYTSVTSLRYHDRASSTQYTRIENSTIIDTVLQASNALPTYIYVMRDFFNFATNTDKFSYFFSGASIVSNRVAFNTAISTYMTSL